MKKIVLLTLMALGIPLVLSAQNVNNDLYYVPSSKKEVKTQEKQEVLVKDKNSVPSSVIVKSSAPVSSEAPVIDEEEYRTDNVASVAPIDDVDAYNRRSSTYGDPEKSQSRSVATTTTTRQKTQTYDDGLDGEWVNGFNGTASDYEYATRIIRFRNPRFAISISSPLYWDVVYGLTAWDWNVYVDGLYAYAFPTYTNRLWWDWRWGSIGLGWGYGWPYYGYNWGWGWNGWYGGWYSPWHSPWYYSSWGWGGWYSPYYSWGWHSGWGWGGGYYAYGHHYYGGWGYGRPYSYNNRRNDLGVGSAGRNLFGRSTRTTSSVARDANGRTGGRVVSGNSGVNTRTIGTSSRVARRATTSTGVGSGTTSTGTGINTRSATTRRSVGTSSATTTTVPRSSSTGVNRTYSTSSSRMNSRTGGSSVGTSTPTRSTTTRSYGNSSSRSYSSGGSFSGGSSGGGFSGGGASTRSSGGGVSSGGGGGGARRR